MQKAKNRRYNGGGKGKAAGYYIINKEILRENAKREKTTETCLKRKKKQNRIFTGAILMDLFKTFDCIPHDSLIAKLHGYGLSFDTVTSHYSYYKQHL